MEASPSAPDRDRPRPLGEHPWRAAALAPLAMPVLYSVVFVCSNPGRQPVLAVLMLAAIGSVISYGSTAFLLLPCLVLVSRFARPSAWVAGIVGTVLGAALYVPFAWIEWKSSGPDSGPPEGSFGQFLRRELFDIGIWAFVLAGLVTALLYWFLARAAAKQAGT